MKLYHFTAASYLPSIILSGLTKGELPFSATETRNAVNLTTDPSGVGHGLSSGQFITPETMRRSGNKLMDGKQIPFFPNKRKIRITVDIHPSQITKWLRWAHKNLDPAWKNGMIKTGGGIAKARTWYFSLTPIAPSSFVCVEVRHDGQWIDATDFTGPWTETLSDAAILQGYANWGERLRTGLPTDLATRLEDLIEHQAYLDELEADALAEASWPQAACVRDDQTRNKLMEKLTFHAETSMDQELQDPQSDHAEMNNCPPCLPPSVNTAVGHRDPSNVDAGR